MSDQHSCYQVKSPTGVTYRGAPSAALVEASYQAGATGIVSAYQSGGVWHPVRYEDVEHYRTQLQLLVLLVYVEVL